MNDPDRNTAPCDRPYLGDRLMPDEPRLGPNFNLRNLGLYSNQLEDLGLDLFVLAKTMRSAVAVTHCGAGIDANDVEFVLGSTKPEPKRRPGVRAAQPISRLTDDVRVTRESAGSRQKDWQYLLFDMEPAM